VADFIENEGSLGLEGDSFINDITNNSLFIAAVNFQIKTGFWKLLFIISRGDRDIS
jgi:hypothetical protein